MPKQINQLYYITHIKNLPSILMRGILSHGQVEAEGLPYERIYDAAIVASRRERETPNGRSLWSFANLFFQPRNPMLYRVLLSRRVEDIVVLGVRPDVLSKLDIYVSLGNAASYYSEIVPSGQVKKALTEIRKWIDNDWWTEEIGLKRKMMAECLVPGVIDPELIQTVYVGSHEAAEAVHQTLASCSLERTPPAVVPEPHMFFRPAREIHLTPQLSLVDGDMFLSKMQAVTVSVNCVGVMGKGLASRAKYQFPDVYVRYQDVCRNKRLKMGTPYLYKRESSLEHQLADDPSSLPNANLATWFLLFATKQHWREASDIRGIDEGLRWVRDNYVKEGISSLAMPALGCGLGRLEWRDVGPLMCHYLSALNIPASIYLPAEKKVPEELLTKEFLLAGDS